MKLREIGDNLFHVVFNKTRNQNETFVRFHGFYENPKFQNNIFTKRQFDRWFRNCTEEGRDLGADFYSIPAGFNIPDYVFGSFFEGKFDPLTRMEKGLLAKIRGINRDKFYLISSLRGDSITLNHEIAHGLFYLNDDYRNEIRDFLKDINFYDYVKMENVMRSENLYAENKLLDEVHATLVSSYARFMKTNSFVDGVCEEELKNYAKNINSIFFKYSKGIKEVSDFKF